MAPLLRWLSPQERAAKFPGIQRLFFSSEAVARNESYDGNGAQIIDAPRMTAEADANLVGSQTDHAGIHMPVLDLDFPARLEPSSTPGHFHLYLDVPLDWNEYTDMLTSLQRVGVLEDGFVGASLAKGGTFVRKPGVLKPINTTPQIAVGDRVRIVEPNFPGQEGVVERKGGIYPLWVRLNDGRELGFYGSEVERV